MLMETTDSRWRDDPQVRDVLRLVNDTLGSDATGVYIYGSAVGAGLRPWSDIDILTMSARTLADADRTKLTDGMLRVSVPLNPGQRLRPLELTVVAVPSVTPWHHPPKLEYLYGEWLRQAFESATPPVYPSEEVDLTTVLAMAVGRSEQLHGPPLGEVVGRIPECDVFASMTQGIPSLLESLSRDVENVLLTFARIWYTLETGEFGSKDEAAGWVLRRMPREHQGALEGAAKWYLGTEPSDAEDWRSTALPCADFMVSRAQELARRRCPDLPQPE